MTDDTWTRPQPDGEGMFDDLIAAWRDLREALAAMMAGPVPAWPWDPTSADFHENRRLRDAVQGKGMRFAGIWRARSEGIRAHVMADPATYPEFHAKPAKGETPDPTSYMQSMVVMPRLMGASG